MNPQFDERDAEILKTRMEALDAIEGPRCGDYVRFSGGEMLRISHLWDDLAQVSEDGSWYLGTSFVSFSGALYPGVQRDALTRTAETRDGSCWFFHHDWSGAGNGVHVMAPFRVYECAVAVSEAK